MTFIKKISKIQKESWLIFFLIFALSSCNSNSISKIDKNAGKVVRIIDGDTYDLLLKDNEKIRIRMYGIDAPEKEPTCECRFL